MHRTPLRSTSIAVAGIAAITLVAVGCGGSESAQMNPGTPSAPTRQATGDTSTCPERNGSFTTQQVIANLLEAPIMLRASEYSCSDWSGVSTPGQVFTNQIIKPGERRTFTLEPRNNVIRNWTMEIVDASSKTSLGKVRMQITTTSGGHWITVPGSKNESLPEGASNTKICSILPLDKQWSPETAWGAIERRQVSVISRGGKVALASRCVTHNTPAAK